MQVQLANVPDNGRGQWALVLGKALADTAAEAGLDNAFANAVWYTSGIFMLWIDLGHDPKVVASVVRRAVDVAYERHIQRHADAEQRELQRLAAETAFRDIVFAARSDWSPSTPSLSRRMNSPVRMATECV